MNSIENKDLLKKQSRIVKERLSYHFASTQGGWNIEDMPPFMKEFLNSIDSNTRVADEEHEANVCLIETAPDMLEMLVIAREELMSIARLQDWHSDKFRYKLDRITATIEKASGMEIEELTNEVQ